MTGIGLENKDTLLFLGAGLAVGPRPRPPLGRRALAVGVGGPRDRAPALGAEPRAGRRRTAGRSSRWRARSPGTPPTTAPRSCRCCGSSPGRCSSRSAPPAWPGSSVAKAAAPWRAIGIAALVALALVFVSGGKAYYAIGSVPVFMAAGAILARPLAGPGPRPPQVRRLRRRRRLSGALIALLTLPILPLADLRQDVAPGGGPRHRQRGRLAAVRRDGRRGGRGAARRTSAPTR